MAKCPKCSARMPDGARFCQACGAHVIAGSKQAKQKRTSSQWMIFIAGALVVILVGGLAMFGIRRGMTGSDHAAAQTTSDDSMAAMVSMAGSMPDWLAKADKSVVADYAWAASHHDELQYFPCFCGCYQSAGHVSNSECYYKRDGKGQVVAYDSHAFG